MTPERYEEIGKLYHAALEAQPEKRGAFLRAACHGDQELLREVESLIALHEESADFMSSPALNVAAELLAQDPDASLVGQSISHYKILSLLGAGGMGEVYLAQDVNLGRRVALKLLPEYSTTDPERVRRFQQEARAASALNHPNILTIYEIGEIAGRHFIATEFVDGETLRGRMRSGSPRFPEALDTATQIAGALAEAHRAGIVHRDIKPENIMIRRDGLVKVLDFGLAKLTEEFPADAGETTRTGFKTGPGAVMGTAHYMSPEQARGLTVDARTDIWSLGVVLYEMLTGKQPFQGETPSHVVVSLIEGEPPPLPQFDPEAPAELQRIVSRALCKDRDERYQSVTEFQHDLTELRLDHRKQTFSSRTGEIIAGRAVSGPANLTARTKRPHLLTVSVAVVVLIGVGIAAGVVAFRKRALFSTARPTATNSPPQMRMKRLTSNGRVLRAALSHDDKYLAIVMENAGKQGLWLRQVGEATDVPIEAPAGADYWGVSFSPDGKYIYYVTWVGNETSAALYRVPSLGGPKQKLIEDIGSSISFSPDGRRIAFVNARSSREESFLVTASADGTDERILATHRNLLQFISYPEAGPSWSPDGQLVVVGESDARTRERKLIAVSVETGAIQQLASQTWSYVSDITWLRDSGGILLAARADNSSPSQLWHLSNPGGEVKRITNDLNSYQGVGLFKNSVALVTVQHEAQASLSSLPSLKSERGLQIDSEVGLGVGTEGAAWTPNGQIVFRSNASGKQDLWICNSDGSQRRQLTFVGSNIHPAISPDGRFIIFSSNHNGAYEIWRINLDGSNPKQLTFSNDDDVYPQCSPDGSWVVFQRGYGWVKGTIWRVPLDGGKEKQITTTMSLRPALSPDGKWIAYYYMDESKWGIAAVPFEGGPRVKTFDIPPTVSSRILRWTPAGDGIAYVDTRNTASNIWVQPFFGGAPKQVSNFNSDHVYYFNWSPNGTQVAIARGDQIRNVVMITGFR